LFNFDKQKIIDHLVKLVNDKAKYLEYVKESLQRKLKDQIIDTNNLSMYHLLGLLECEIDRQMRWEAAMVTDDSMQKEVLMTQWAEMSNFFHYEYPVYEFQLDKIIKHSNNIVNLNDQIIYLEYALDKLKCYDSDISEIDINYTVINPKLDEELKSEISHKKRILKESTDPSQIIAKPIEKIRWKGTDTQLVYLFQGLFETGLLDGNDQYYRRNALIRDHFINKSDKEYSNKQLAQTEQNLQTNLDNKPRNSDRIDKVINKVYYPKD
jgi:hypothetical protein